MKAREEEKKAERMAVVADAETSAAERRVRTTARHLVGIQTQACAAIGATEESAAVAMAVGGSGQSEEDDPYAIEQDFVDLDGIDEIPLVGTDVDLSEDYVAGLNMMAQRCHPETKLGYVDTIESGHILMVTKPASVRKVLTSSVQHFLGGLRPPSAAFFGHKVLFILEGKEWLDLRNVLKKSFQKHNVGLMSEDMAWAAEGFDAILNKYAQSGEDLDFMRAVGAFHLNAIAKVSFDYDIGAIEGFEDGEHPIEESFEYLLEELPRRSYAPDWETQNDFESDNEDNRNMAKYSWQARDVIRTVIRKRLAEIEAGATPRGDLLQKMIDVYTEDYPEARGDEEMLTAELGDNLVEIMFAGYNTAVPTSAHALFLLANYPEYAQRVKEEVDTVLQGRRPTMDDIKSLKFCERVYMEALRLFPPASLIARQTTKDVELDGMIIPRATRVWLPACAIHRDADSWEDPMVFNPDRFASKIVRGSFIPFSDGPRNCAGRNFAMYEGITALATVFAKYDVSVNESFDHSTVFTGFGLRPFDFNTARVCMRLNVHPRQDL
ncbi:4-cineole 2-exo-monooxygenase) (1 [Durusdinium trenchii]|uniref:4-cineole 2-exo-monooxygenase) (1 n=1 Tax=Durusdinium trenchii TaxID=1381693 RepID=A0ABP0RSK2_9DINO